MYLKPQSSEIWEFPQKHSRCVASEAPSKAQVVPSLVIKQGKNLEGGFNANTLELHSSLSIGISGSYGGGAVPYTV